MPTRLTTLLEPLGTLEVDLPVDVTDADGDVVAEAGVADARRRRRGGRAHGARPGDVPAVEQYPAAEAVWAAVAAAIGDGAVRRRHDGDARQVPAARWLARRHPRRALAAGPVGAARAADRGRSTPAPNPRRSRRRPARPVGAGARVRADRARQGGGTEPGAVRAHRGDVHRRAAGRDRADQHRRRLRRRVADPVRRRQRPVGRHRRRATSRPRRRHRHRGRRRDADGRHRRRRGPVRPDRRRRRRDAGSSASTPRSASARTTSSCSPRTDRRCPPCRRTDELRRGAGRRRPSRRAADD